MHASSSSAVVYTAPLSLEEIKKKLGVVVSTLSRYIGNAFSLGHRHQYDSAMQYYTTSSTFCTSMPRGLHFRTFHLLLYIQKSLQEELANIQRDLNGITKEK